MTARKPLGFQISINGRDDGTLEALYIRLSTNKVARTDEVPGESEVLADYDSAGRLVGIEILSPVKLRKLVGLVDEPRRRPFSKFVRSAAPEQLVCA
jgi:uncharacterized protein YuzE